MSAAGYSHLLCPCHFHVFGLYLNDSVFLFSSIVVVVVLVVVAVVYVFCLIVV